MLKNVFHFVLALSVLNAAPLSAWQAESDTLRDIQSEAIHSGTATWGYWGVAADKYQGCQQHSNRLIPVYTFGVTLESYKGSRSVYRQAAEIERLYGKVSAGTLNPNAEYFDQTQLYDLQRKAIADGKKYIFLFVFDGLDWQETQIAATVANRSVAYDRGRGTGLHFLDYRAPVGDFGWMVTSPRADRFSFDVDAQVGSPVDDAIGGYNPKLGGGEPWATPLVPEYLLGQYRECADLVTDSAASATSMCSGIKTYNAAINVDREGNQVVPIARQLQADKGFSIGVVTSVPISHATPAAAYANNVSRDDYQDLSRDLLGLPSVAHRDPPLPGVDVLLGCGWGKTLEADDKQGADFVPGNRYLTDEDLRLVDGRHGGRYEVVIRESGQCGADALAGAANAAVKNETRLLGFFGCDADHLPFQTADGHFDPADGKKSAERYADEDLRENPTLAQMTQAAIQVLEKNHQGFWLMVEAGDVDWANHDDNIDNAVGAIFSGDDAVRVITDWIDAHDAWQQSALIVTADHGHYFHLTDATVLINKQPRHGASK